MDDQAGITYQFDIVEIYFEQHSETPNTIPVTARPYEFNDDGSASKFATACPHCGQGNFPEAETLYEHGGKLFAKCEVCGVGENETQDKLNALTFEDPFQNPIKNGIITSTTTMGEIEEDDTPLSEKFQTIAEQAKEEIKEMADQPNDVELSEDEKEYLDSLLEEEMEEDE
jgi:hypothetical protein